MTVYVDDMYRLARGKLRRMKMSHMIADTVPELHAMAVRIGVARRWFQETHSGPHYDVCKRARLVAIAAGAVPVTVRQATLMMANLRASGTLTTPETAEIAWRARRNDADQRRVA